MTGSRFLALMLAALALGLVAGLGPADTIESFQSGAGDTLGNVGIILALGTMLGALSSCCCSGWWCESG